jgi:hypothetical protein
MPDGTPLALRLPAIGIVIGLALPAPAIACSVSTKRPELLEAASELAVMAVAEVSTFVLNDSVWSGVITLDVKSIASNKTGLPVPKRITATFAVRLDDDPCGQWVPDPDDAATKYFLNVVNGQFLIQGSL